MTLRRAARPGLALVVALVAMVTLPQAPADAKAVKALWGPARLPDRASAMPVYRDLGVDVLQMELGWHDVAPKRPDDPLDPADPGYRWHTSIDEAIAKGRRHGITVALLVRGSPAWVNGARGVDYAPPARAFGQFVTAAARRYPAVRRWMIWGEPNRVGAFRPLPRNDSTGPRRYARLLDSAYRALKRSNRRNLVIGGNTFAFGEMMPRDFVRRMRLPNGKPPPLDMYGHNPFSSRFPDISMDPFGGYPDSFDFGDLDRLRVALARTYRGEYHQFRRRGPRIWISEYSVSSDRSNDYFDFFVSRREQARWLTAAYQAEARAPWIAGLGWAGLLDGLPSNPTHHTTGLMTWEGERKPAYFAYRRVP